MGPRLRRQGGQETLQAILAVSLVLLPVLFATVQMGTLLHLWIGQNAAAAVGARLAGERGQGDAFVLERIDAELSAAGIDPSRSRVKVIPPRAGWGEPITVTIETDLKLAIPFLPLQQPTVPLRSSFTARGEVNH